MQVSDDFEFWKWVGGALVAVASGLVGGGWAGRGILESLRLKITATQATVDASVARIDATVDASVARIATLEARQEAQSAEIRHCVAEIREGVAEIRQGVAVVSALHEETQKDVREIFERLNVRSIDIPHDEERRHG